MLKHMLAMQIMVFKIPFCSQFVGNELDEQSLLVCWNTFLVLNLSFDIVNGVGALHLQSDGLATKGFDEDMHTTS